MVENTCLGRLALVFLMMTGNALAGETVRLQRDGVLGTSFEIEVAGSQAQARHAERAALAEVARLERLLSTWHEGSELSAYNAGVLKRTELSSDTIAVLELCEHWRQRSHGAFSCRLGDISRQWRAASVQNQLPDRVQLRRQARTLATLEEPDLAQLDPNSGLRFDVDGVAKGYILDRALAYVRAQVPQLAGIRIDIGGDSVHWGRPESAKSWTVDVADPNKPIDNGVAIATVKMDEQRGMASSGHRSRGYKIGRRHFSHILDPNEGWPLSYAPSAIVIATDAASADALATVLTVLPIRDGLALVEEIEDAAALIISDSGIAFASARWPHFLDATAERKHVEKTQLEIDYEIPAQVAENYRRPYLALWIERVDGSRVRQLHVLGDRARWLGELPRWWRQYGRDDPAGALGLARPTRAPGNYTLAWDGRDDVGHMQPPGDYVLRVEAARERGGHDELTVPFTLDGSEKQIRHQSKGEIGTLLLRFLPK